MPGRAGTAYAAGAETEPLPRRAAHPAVTATPPAPNALAAPAAAPPVSRWDGAGAAWTLHLAGDWRGRRSALPEPPPALRTLESGQVVVDSRALEGWDGHFAAALWQRLDPLARRHLKVDLQGLPPTLRLIVAMALPGPAAAATPARPPPERALAVLGLQALASADRARDTLRFVGEVVLALMRLLRGRTDMRRIDLAWQIEQTGPRSVPIVALVSLLVGLILAYMGAAQLVRFGAQTFIADLVTVGVVREIAALLVGIVLAGRVGAAFAAQLGNMVANEEIDALRTLGVDPIEHLVLPRLLALLIAGPLLTALAALAGVGVGWAAAVVIFDVSAQEYLVRSVQALTAAHLGIGLLKGTVYAVLVALAGCRQGLAAGRSAQAVGDAATAAVVQSIVWIAAAASLLTVVFQRLGW